MKKFKLKRTKKKVVSDKNIFLSPKKEKPEKELTYGQGLWVYD